MHQNSDKLRSERITLIAALALVLVVIFTGACNKSAGGSSSLSPSDTVKAYVDAAGKKDVAGMKKHLSQGTIKMAEDNAKKMGKNVDEMLKAEADNMPSETAQVTYSNEKVSGDTATVDLTAKGQTVTMPLIKEGGQWKLAIDKFVEELRKKMGDRTTP